MKNNILGKNFVRRNFFARKTGVLAVVVFLAFLGVSIAALSFATTYDDGTYGPYVVDAPAGELSPADVVYDNTSGSVLTVATTAALTISNADPAEAITGSIQVDIDPSSGGGRQPTSPFPALMSATT